MGAYKEETMDRIVVSLLLSVLMTGCTAGVREMTEAERTAVREEVSQHFSGFWQAWSQVDPDRGWAYHDDHADYSFAENGRSWTSRASVQTEFAPGFASTKSQTFNFGEPRVAVLSRDLVYVTWQGTLAATRVDGTLEATRPFVFTALWVKVNGEWKVRFAHESTQEPESQQ